MLKTKGVVEASRKINSATLVRRQLGKRKAVSMWRLGEFRVARLVCWHSPQGRSREMTEMSGVENKKRRVAIVASPNLLEEHLKVFISS
jgi:hypothetical protein